MIVDQIKQKLLNYNIDLSTVSTIIALQCIKNYWFINLVIDQESFNLLKIKTNITSTYKYVSDDGSIIHLNEKFNLLISDLPMFYPDHYDRHLSFQITSLEDLDFELSKRKFLT